MLPFINRFTFFIQWSNQSVNALTHAQCAVTHSNIWKKISYWLQRHKETATPYDENRCNKIPFCYSFCFALLFTNLDYLLKHIKVSNNVEAVCSSNSNSGSITTTKYHISEAHKIAWTLLLAEIITQSNDTKERRINRKIAT